MMVISPPPPPPPQVYAGHCQIQTTSRALLDTSECWPDHPCLMPQKCPPRIREPLKEERLNYCSLEVRGLGVGETLVMR